MSLVEIDHKDYWRCPVCGIHCDVWDWGDEVGDGDHYYENPSYRCEDCDIGWDVEKIYNFSHAIVKIENRYVDPNNIDSYKLRGVIKIHGQE